MNDAERSRGGGDKNEVIWEEGVSKNVILGVTYFLNEPIYVVIVRSRAFEKISLVHVSKTCCHQTLAAVSRTTQKHEFSSD